MGIPDGFARVHTSRQLLAVVAVVLTACGSPDPLISYLDDESGLSLTHPPRWTIGAAEQEGLRYRYLTAPKLEGDKDALSVTLIAPTGAPSADAAAAAYLSGASGVSTTAGPAGATTWAFKDPSGVNSKLRLAPGGEGRFFGAWVRGSEAAMRRYEQRVNVLLDSLRVEAAPAWPEERFAGLAVRVPAAWTRGSRLSNATNATMQFKSPPLSVDKGTDTIHGFVTLAREPILPPADLETFSRALKGRASGTFATLQHGVWPATPGLDRPEGYVDYQRSGTPVSSTRIKRWISARGGVGLSFTCEARADAFDRLEPWCRRMAETVRFD
jgi:hypothetical protein